MIVETERGSLAVSRHGSGGQTVLLLHSLALCGAMWEPFARRLAERYTVLAPDARGHGGSGWDGAAFSVDDLAADAAAVLEATGGPAHVIGLSMGGSTALVLAASRPDLVRRLVLADTTACYGPDRQQRWAERAHNAMTRPRAEQVGFQVDRWFSDRFRRDGPDEVARIAALFEATDSAAHAAACHALGGLDATDRLPAVTAETLVLAGDEDYATPPEMARSIAESVPSSALRILAGTRHLSLLERPDIWPALLDFLTGRTALAEVDCV